MDIYRRDVKKLRTLRHPNVIRVVDVLEENKKYIALVTEPILCSVANMCKNFTNIPFDSVPMDLKSQNLTPFEITCGLV